MLIGIRLQILVSILRRCRMVTYCDIEGCNKKGKCREYLDKDYVYYSDLCNNHAKEFKKKVEEYKRGVDKILATYNFNTCEPRGVDWMVYEITKHYVRDYCGMKQTEDEQVGVLGGDYILRQTNYSPCVPADGIILRYACKSCIRKGLVPGYSIWVGRMIDEIIIITKMLSIGVALFGIACLFIVKETIEEREWSFAFLFLSGAVLLFSASLILWWIEWLKSVISKRTVNIVE